MIEQDIRGKQTRRRLFAIAYYSIKLLVVWMNWYYYTCAALASLTRATTAARLPDWQWIKQGEGRESITWEAFSIKLASISLRDNKRRLVVRRMRERGKLLIIYLDLFINHITYLELFSGRWTYWIPFDSHILSSNGIYPINTK